MAAGNIISTMPRVVHEVNYRGGCEQCHGFSIAGWEHDGFNEAKRHQRETGHKGIWYSRHANSVFALTEPVKWFDAHEREHGKGCGNDR